MKKMLSVFALSIFLSPFYVSDAEAAEIRREGEGLYRCCCSMDEYMNADCVTGSRRKCRRFIRDWCEPNGLGFSMVLLLNPNAVSEEGDEINQSFQKN